ncbi:hypothetical protein SAMN02745121_02455 [Nannocystis exedens]|uniref:Uncharacterized protein n=1 Tax=Nannocystis exedens TaxID=54 RepID=A0A1I1WKC7_9BACT|nr:hypothetical protein NAEX_00827 [Nannocystis exedens]SFD95674.1 hypothetical protein SAMN02745121_02455 [Nannocystis exedens]
MPAAQRPEPLAGPVHDLGSSPAPRDDAAVHHDDFARRVLYTWTTPAQIDALRRSRRLLVADGGVGERSPYLRALDRLVEAHPLAAILRDHPGHRRRRYAWTSPLATTLGLGERRYGDALVRIDLAGDALVIGFRPHAAEPFVAQDMSGRTVDLAVALADPGRIGAVYHVRDGPDDPIAFREYVVCNESQVAAWSVATPEIRAHLDAELALLESLRRGDLAHLPPAAVRSPAVGVWATAPREPTPLDRWHARLAFDNERYRPTPVNLAAVAAALRGYDPAGEPLVHRPDVTFPAPQNSP